MLKGGGGPVVSGLVEGTEGSVLRNGPTIDYVSMVVLKVTFFVVWLKDLFASSSIILLQGGFVRKLEDASHHGFKVQVVLNGSTYIGKVLNELLFGDDFVSMAPIQVVQEQH